MAAGQADVTRETVQESDQRAEKIGEIDEARFKPAAGEAREEINQALSRAFPDPEARAQRGK